MCQTIKIQVVISSGANPELMEELKGVPVRMRAERLRSLALLGVRGNGSDGMSGGMPARSEHVKKGERRISPKKFKAQLKM